jgi:hypothetical protein
MCGFRSRNWQPRAPLTSLGRYEYTLPHFLPQHAPSLITVPTHTERFPFLSIGLSPLSAMSELPSHASPGFPPLYSPQPGRHDPFDDPNSDEDLGRHAVRNNAGSNTQQREPPASIISPAFTPPATPGLDTLTSAAPALDTRRHIGDGRHSATESTPEAA